MERNIFLVEILGMTNYCNLNCGYCDWQKETPYQLGKDNMDKVREHLSESRLFIQRHFPRACMIEYSGGEPYMYPEIVSELLHTFPDHWVRIITNGLLLTEHDINCLKCHGKAFVAVSLDGETVDKNINRFQDEKKLNRIINNIDALLLAKVPVMILCVLNYDNIDGFPEFLRYVMERWSDAVERGMLVLPAHWLDEYRIIHRKASAEQIERLKERLEDFNLPVYERIKEHYRALFASHRRCDIYRWSASIHFYREAIASTGEFCAFRCGMRAIGPVGKFLIGEEVEKDTYSEVFREADEVNFQGFHCKCFIDWVSFDLIFSGIIPLERAKEWFVIFRDKKVEKWIADYQEMLAKENRPVFTDGEFYRQKTFHQMTSQKEGIKMAFNSEFFLNNIDAVFFDLYGTLLDVKRRTMEREQWEGMVQFLGYQGAVYDIHELISDFSRYKAEAVESAGQNINPEREIDEYHIYKKLYENKGIDADEKLINITAQFFIASQTQYCRPYSGAKELIEGLRMAGKKICLLSNAQRIYTEPEMKMSGMDDWFDEIRLSSDWGIKKPSLKFFRELISCVGVKPSRILMVGNDVVDDIMPARGLMMYTCYIHSNLSRFDEIPPCTIYLEENALVRLKEVLLEG